MTKTASNIEPKIDAVALVRAIRDAQAEQIQGMTPDQQIAFYRAKAKELLSKLQRMQPVEQNTPPCDITPLRPALAAPGDGAYNDASSFEPTCHPPDHR